MVRAEVRVGRVARRASVLRLMQAECTVRVAHVLFAVPRRVVCGLQVLRAVQAHAHAAATLISAMPETPFGCPNALLVGALSAAAALAGRGEERSGAAWLTPTLTP